MIRDDDKRQSHPRPMSSGSHSSSENGHYVNPNNWPRRQGGWDNDKSRRADSPRRDRERSRSPERRKDREPTLGKPSLPHKGPTTNDVLQTTSNPSQCRASGPPTGVRTTPHRSSSSTTETKCVQ